MPSWLRRSGPLTLCLFLLMACGSKHAERPGSVRGATRSRQAPARPPGDDLYAADEALRDALSGRWEYLGTGPWPGGNRLHACAFRNDRVIMVSTYCSIKEPPAFRLDVYNPERGRVRIYAEANGPVSKRTRQQYFTFTVESEPRPPPEARLPALRLTISFEQLLRYEELRYAANLPGCFGGQERRQERGGCLDALAPRAAAWQARNRAFLEQASDDWYRIVHELRALSARYGKEPVAATSTRALRADGDRYTPRNGSP